MNKQEKATTGQADELADLPTHTITDDENIALWQYFSGRADTLKDKLWTIATWLLAVASGLLGFIFSQKFVLFDASGLSAQQPLPALALAVAGILICAFSLVVIVDHGKHIQRNWDRATYVKRRITPLDRILKADEQENASKGECQNEEAGKSGGQDENSKQDEKPGMLAGFSAQPRICRYLIVIVLSYLAIYVGIAGLAVVSLLVTAISAVVNFMVW